MHVLAVDNLALIGEIDEATEIFERLLKLRNDVGLLSEEWDIARERQVGNFPQAFDSRGLVNSAYNLDRARQSHGPRRCARPSSRVHPACTWATASEAYARAG